MAEPIEMQLEKAINLELYVSELYMLYYRKFPEDSTFWWQLAIEEQNHAALLKTVWQMNRAELKIPGELLGAGIEELELSIQSVRQAIHEIESHPDRNRAFHFAYLTEVGAGEYHFNAFMKYSAESRLTDVFRRLNGADTDHAKRIVKYMKDHRIPMPDQSDAGLRP